MAIGCLLPCERDYVKTSDQKYGNAVYSILPPRLNLYSIYDFEFGWLYDCTSAARKYSPDALCFHSNRKMLFFESKYSFLVERRFVQRKQSSIQRKVVSSENKALSNGNKIVSSEKNIFFSENRSVYRGKEASSI